MKKLFIALTCMASLAIVTACGGGNASKNQAEAPAEGEATEQAAAKEAAETTADAAGNSQMTLEEFSAKLKEFCGIEPIVSDKMTKIVVREQNGEYFMSSPVAEDIDKEAVQREYFNAFAKVADGNKIYGFHMNRTRGDDAFKNYDDYVKFIKTNGDYDKATYGYDYNGKKIEVYCSVAFGDFGLTVKEAK